METFDLGPFSIQIWGLLVALGLLIGLLYSIGRSKKFKKAKISSENLYDIFIIVFITGIFGARLFYVIEHLSEFTESIFDFVNIFKGGLNLYGGLVFGALGCLLYLKHKKKSFWQAADIIAPGLAIGVGIGRIGDFLLNNHVGERTKFFLGMIYKGDLRLSPSLYLCINAFVLFFVLTLLWPFIKRKSGLTAYIFIVWYSFTRFLLDFTRASDILEVSDPRFYSFTLSQWVSVVIFVIFLPLLIIKLKKK